MRRPYWASLQDLIFTTAVSVETPNLGVSLNKSEAHFNARKKDELTYRKNFTCQVIVKLLIILLNQPVMDFGRGFGDDEVKQAFSEALNSQESQG